MYKKYNPNPLSKSVGDCVVRAITKATDSTWLNTYAALAVQGYAMADMPSSNVVWSAYLHDNGFTRHAIPDTCPNCYTIADFADDHKDGIYLLATGTHVVAVIDGDYYDNWDSGNEVPIFYWTKER